MAEYRNTRAQLFNKGFRLRRNEIWMTYRDERYIYVAQVVQLSICQRRLAVVAALREADAALGPGGNRVAGVALDVVKPRNYDESHSGGHDFPPFGCIASIYK